MSNKNSVTGLIILCLLAGAMVGAIISYSAFPRTDDTKVAELSKIIDQIDAENRELQLAIYKLESRPAEKIIETVNVTNEIPLDIRGTYLNPTIAEVIDYLDDEELLKCDGDEYDLDEITVSRVYNEFKVEYSDIDEYTVSGEIKLSFKQDEEKRCRSNVAFSVFYEPDEDPVVTIL